MTPNEPETVAYLHTNTEKPEIRGVSLYHDISCINTEVSTEPLIRLGDYKALQDVVEGLQDNCLKLSANCLELSQVLVESLANDRQAMSYLNQVREIVGGDDFPDMVKRCGELKLKNENRST